MSAFSVSHFDWPLFLKRPEEDAARLFRNTRTPSQALGRIAKISKARPESLRLARGIVEGALAEHPEEETRSEALIISTAAIALRQPVHVFCRSAVAARERAIASEPLLHHLGLSCTAIAVSDDQDDRLAAYSKRVVFASSDVFAKDHLRDQVQAASSNVPYRTTVASLARTSLQVQRFIPRDCAALIDDADLILTSQSRPTSLANEAEIDIGRRLAEEAFEALRALAPGVDYTKDPLTGRISLTDEGERRLSTYAAVFRGPWSDPKWRQETIFSALIIRDTYVNGQDYQVGDTGITLRKLPGADVDGPSIPDLIAAKESLARTPRQLHTIDLRRLLPKFASLGGVGLDMGRNRTEISETMSLNVIGQPGSHTIAPPRVHTDRDDWCKSMSGIDLPGVLIWAATEADAEALVAQNIYPAVISSEVLDFTRPFHLVQAGGAPNALTARIADKWQGIRWSVETSPDDGFLSLLPPEHPSKIQLAAKPCAETYQAALAAAEEIANDKRGRRAQSEAYFDRILDFLEPMT